MLYLLTMLTLLIQPEAKTQKVVFILEHVPSGQVNAFDPVFVRTSIHNQSEQVVKVPQKTFSSTHYRLFRRPYSYSYPNYLAGETLHPPESYRTIAIGQKLPIDYEILELPPINEWGHPFWRTTSSSGLSLDLSAQIAIELPGEHVHVSNTLATTSFATLNIKSRPKEEMKFLTELFAEASARNQQRREGSLQSYEPTPFDIATPHYFGFSAIGYPDLEDRLLGYEKNLSKGTLRDIVHLVNRLRELVRESEEIQQKQIVTDLITWLDTLPEVQREALSIHIIEWLPRHKHDRYAFHHLHYECMLRAPAKFDTEDYRRTLDGKFYLPGYKAYLEQRKTSEKSDTTETPPPE